VLLPPLLPQAASAATITRQRSNARIFFISFFLSFLMVGFA
jgi:hypothetical protein